jgi:hypothetical protein
VPRVPVRRPRAVTPEAQEGRKESEGIARDVATLKEATTRRLVNLGTIAAFVPPFGEEADGWVECDGQTITASDYPEFFRLLGPQTTYTTPNIPALIGTITWWVYAGRRA